MNFILSSAILAQILPSTTTSVSGEGKRFLLNKQRRAARARRLAGKQIFSSFVSNKSPPETPLEPPEAKPLRNAHQYFFDRVVFPHVRSSSNENNYVAEADVGLLAQQSPGPADDVIFESKDSGSNRRLRSYCDYLVYDGFDCDCSQVDETTYMGSLSCSQTSEEFCNCQDMDLGKQICWSYSATLVFEGNITYDGRKTLSVDVCFPIYKTYLEEIPVPLLCITYNYDEDGVVVEECTMTLGGTVCNLCTTSTFEYGNYTNYCFDFDCENLGDVATGTKVGSTCPGTNEWPLLTFEQNVTDLCPAEVSGPDDSTPTGDDAPAPSGDETPGTDGAVLHASSSLSSVGGTIAVIVWLFAIGM